MVCKWKILLKTAKIAGATTGWQPTVDKFPSALGSCQLQKVLYLPQQNMKWFYEAMDNIVLQKQIYFMSKFV